MRIIIDDSDGEEFIIPVYLVETRPTEPYLLFFLQIQYFQGIFRYRLLWGQVSGAAWDIRGWNPTGHGSWLDIFQLTTYVQAYKLFFVCLPCTWKSSCKNSAVLKMEKKLHWEYPDTQLIGWIIDFRQQKCWEWVTNSGVAILGRPNQSGDPHQSPPIRRRGLSVV